MSNKFTPRLSRLERRPSQSTKAPQIPDNPPQQQQPEERENPMEVPQEYPLNFIEALKGFEAQEPGIEGDYFPFGDGQQGFTRYVISQFVRQNKLGKKGRKRKISFTHTSSQSASLDSAT
jgi:hypothetical protein